MAAKRPVIGVTSDYNDKQTQYAIPYAYCESVERAGGLPLMLPYRCEVASVAAFVDQLDGVLFCGGNDLDPAAYGEAWHARAVPIDPARERFERALLAEVERRRTPALGICLGSQLMNVHRGGSMVQFLPDMPGLLEHRREAEAWGRRHEVRLDPESTLARRLGKNLVSVNTSHKQAIRSPGNGLRVIATSPDGVIEGVEDPSLPLYLGVQWHPERLGTEPDHHALFTLLVERAAGTQSK